jgi:hypothetical protein
MYCLWKTLEVTNEDIPPAKMFEVIKVKMIEAGLNNVVINPPNLSGGVEGHWAQDTVVNVGWVKYGQFPYTLIVVCFGNHDKDVNDIFNKLLNALESAKYLKKDTYEHFGAQCHPGQLNPSCPGKNHIWLRCKTHYEIGGDGKPHQVGWDCDHLT